MGNGAEMVEKVEPRAGRQGGTEERRKIRNGLKIWTECHVRGRGKTLSTIENSKVPTEKTVSTLGFSIVLSVGGGKGDGYPDL